MLQKTRKTKKEHQNHPIADNSTTTQAKTGKKMIHEDQSFHSLWSTCITLLKIGF
jgi:hypothetical protein